MPPARRPPFSRSAGRPFEPVDFEARLRAVRERVPFEFPADAVPTHFRRSSVMICFWHEAEATRVLLTQRARSMRTQPGQMSFPGGRLEPGEDWVAGALRETQEEVGIPEDAIEVLGRLDDAWSGAGHLLVPIVGWLPERPEMKLNPAEVDRVHMPSVEELLAPQAFAFEEADLDGDIVYNETLRWADGHAFGLTTDLLIEAIREGLGEREPHGQTRLANLHSWLRMRAKQGEAEAAG